MFHQQNRNDKQCKPFLATFSCALLNLNDHCIKSVRIPSYTDPYFPAFGLNTERYVSLRIQSECGKMRTRITPNTDTFQAVDILAKQCFRKTFSTLPITAFQKIPEWTKLVVEKNITKNTSELKKMMQESVHHVLRYLPTRILPLQNSIHI